MNLRPRTISAKLTWMNMLVCTFALVIACVAFLIYDQISVRQAIVNNLSGQAQIIGANSVSALTFNDPQAATTTLSALHSFPNIIAGGVTTPNGALFAKYSRDGENVFTVPTLRDGEQEAHTFSANEIVLVRAIDFDGKKVGAVFLRGDMRVAQRRLKRYLSIAGGVLVLCLIAALLASRTMRKSVAAPIVRLADVAGEVSRRQDYSLRAAPTRENDELSLLINSFNTMLGEIQRRDEALQQIRNELEVKVDQRTRQLLASNRELEAFSYSVSHDLRGPLETISGFGHLLLTSGGDRLNEAERMYVEEIRRSTRHMGQLIEDLLNLSRVSTTEMHKVKVDLSEMVRATCRQLMSRETGREVEFKIAECPAAEGDPRLLQLVIENLVNNSWKYTSSHTKAIIEFGCKMDMGRTVYFVRDDGAGFDPGLANRLFKPFQRLHSMSEFPGTGIGLATVQRIVQRHGGEIWSESEIEKGATFYFTVVASSNKAAAG
jgi:signal transduction histidine kinase